MKHFGGYSNQGDNHSREYVTERNATDMQLLFNTLKLLF